MDSTKNIEHKTKEILAQRLGIEADKIDVAQSIYELGLDSFSAVELAFALKDEFKLSVHEREFSDIKTVNDLIKYVQEKIKAEREQK